MSNLISIGCLVGLMLGIWLSYNTPASGNGQKISGTFAKMRRYMK